MAPKDDIDLSKPKFDFATFKAYTEKNLPEESQTVTNLLNSVRRLQGYLDRISKILDKEDCEDKFPELLKVYVQWLDGIDKLKEERLVEEVLGGAENMDEKWQTCVSRDTKDIWEDLL